VRHWRRSRRTVTLSEAVQEVYIWLLAALMLGSMLVSVLVNVSHLGDRSCAASDCTAARSLLPWLAVGTALAGCWMLARMLGPVAVSPGVASWLMPTPVDRGELLRGRVRSTTLLGAMAVAPVAAATATLAGYDVSDLLLFTVGTAALASCGIGALAHAQGRARHPARLLAPASLIAVGAGLAAIAASRAPELGGAGGSLALASVAALWVGVVGVLLRAQHLAQRLRVADVAPGGALLPGVGGALASLDLALAFDVVVAHGSRRRGAVTAVRGGPTGVAALMWRDVVRLLRSPGRPLILFAALLVPYAMAAVGGGVVTLVVEVLVCFVLVIPLLVSLRVLARSSGMVRMFPAPLGWTRAAALVVPGALVVAHGALCVFALRQTLDVTPVQAAALGASAGLAGLAAGTRWVTGRPPDYGRPLVSSPAGGVPTNLYGSVLRGFDVAVLGAVPMVLLPTSGGAMLSAGLCLVVVAWLCGRK